MFHTSLSPSPIHRCFSYMEWNGPSGIHATRTIAVSNPERSLLKSAEANPLEYTLADSEDAVLYTRILLKVLDQVTGPSHKGNALALDDEVLQDDDALEYYQEQPTGVVTHYIIQRLYDVIAILCEQTNSTPKQQPQRPTIQSVFYTNNGTTLMDDWRPLLRLLYQLSGDAFAQRGAALCLAYILKANAPGQADETLQSLISWLTSRLQSSHTHTTSLGVVTPTLVVLATCPPARRLLDQAGGIGYLSRHLSTNQNSNSSRTNTRRGTSAKNSNNVQHLYELVFCLWTLTFDCATNEAMRQHFLRDGAISALSHLLASAPREKVVRLALGSLCNLAEWPDLVREMIGCGVLQSVQQLHDRQWTDPDVFEDLDRLYSILQDNYKELTRWEVFLAELESGRLQWGILHTEQFVKENVRRMEDNDFWAVKRLLHLLLWKNNSNNDDDDDDDDDVTAICLFDLGEFVRQYPNGRVIAKRLGAKPIVMPLMEHSNPEIQRQALLCVSKMLVQKNWMAVGNFPSSSS